MASATAAMDFSKYNFQLRPSHETDRRHLLAPDSVAPSESASMIYTPGEIDGDRTPRAHSPAPSYTTQQHRRETIADPTHIPHQQQQPQPYKGFPSQAAYLAALEEWAESKRWIHFDAQLKGFYGQTTTADYLSRPRAEMSLGLKEKWRARKARRDSKKADADGGEVKVGRGGERRNTVV